MDYSDLTVDWTRYVLSFERPAQTSRDTLKERVVWFVILRSRSLDRFGIGECAPISGLSIDRLGCIERQLTEICRRPRDYLENLEDSLSAYPSLRFALEMAWRDLDNQGNRILYPSSFTSGAETVKINGLIWMGDPDYMLAQIERKLAQGWKCIKVKVGGIAFDQELELLARIRKVYDAGQLELRVDANGAFGADEAMGKIRKLAEYDLHSIEQPLRPGNWPPMERLCRESPVPVALDEELVFITSTEESAKMIHEVRPQYLVLKPSLLGGFKACERWIGLAEAESVKWWITSALESNVGLNAIAQWTHHLGPKGHQGLGTGELYSNNIPSPLSHRRGELRYSPAAVWDLSVITGEGG